MNRNSKYRAVKTEVDGILFDSKKEAAYYKRLLLQKKAVNKADRVVDIELQPRFNYVICYEAENGRSTYRKKAFYRADFQVTYADHHIEVIDVKGYKTPEYKRKKRIVKELFDINIIEK